MGPISHAFMHFLLLSFHSLAFSERCNPNDKKAHLKIKKDLNNADAFTSWDRNTDCCDWNMVKCDDSKTNRITQLDVSYAHLNLPIPAAVADLPHLQILRFHHAAVTGEIPPPISKLSDLNVLDLRWNSLTGPVPSSLSKLNKLTYLELSSNDLTGPIPPSHSQLPNLVGLRLDRNKLT